MENPDYRVVILGAGASLRGGVPAALSPIGDRGRLLDWLLSAFAGLPDCEVDFVSGYMAREVMQQYRDIRFHHNPEWERTGPARSLAVAPLSSRVATFVCYSDVVFRRDTVERLEGVGDALVVAIDSSWKERYDGRLSGELEESEKVVLASDSIVAVGKSIAVADAAAEFAGLFRLSGATAARLENVLSSSSFRDSDGIPEVISFLAEHGVRARPLDVRGEWAELNAPQDLARFVLGTKAESLERLRPLLTSGHILEVTRFTGYEFTERPDAVALAIQEKFPASSVIIRSSSLSEDSWSESAAGAYLSIPSVPTHDASAVREALGRVFASYGDPNPGHQVLVQEMLLDVRMNGVVMTRTHAQGAPYYVVNYDDTTSRTDSVTAGDVADLNTLFLHRDAALPADASPDLTAVMETVRELEQLVGHDSLDIEFAVTRSGDVVVLQVRPIAVSRDNISGNDDGIRDGIRDARRFLAGLGTPSPFVLGGFTSLSVMSDWNPAEIIGTKPAPLAFSLYRYIITDETWATQRAEYGYRDVRPCPLLIDILGHPYVDVRATFNSFCPAVVPEELARRLIEAQLRRLAEHPELHDKVEFDVLFTCWHFDLDEQQAERFGDAFDEAERNLVRDALRDLTRRGIARCAADLAALDAVSERHERIRASAVSDLDKAYLHLENARVNGALHFSHLARGAFVAVTMLRSMVRKGLVVAEEMDGFLASLRTVSSDLQTDAEAVAAGRQGWDELVAKYGHLRPGTYDINSTAYGEAPEEFLRPIVDACSGPSHADETFRWRDGTAARVEEALGEAGFEVSFGDLEAFLRQAIEGREYGKFVFTRDLSAALESLGSFARDHFVSRRELSFTRIHDLLALRAAGLRDVSQELKKLSAEGRRAFEIHQAVCLPDQIFAPEDVACFQHRRAVPNYVTNKHVRAELVALSNTSSPSVDLAHKIVLIPNADPGFDWIFSRDIAGLITMYGGTNSHMAIRMAEFELPGVTGIGELLYEKIRSARLVELDCGSRQIRIVE